MSPPNEHVEGYPKLLDWLRYFCAFLLYMYGVSKLLHFQFNLAELAPRPIGSLSGYQLTWFYFGYSRIYACILGLTQVAGATLLLFRKTTLLGAAVMLPVMANILLINIFILVNDYGPYVNAAILCCSLLTILWHQRARLLALFWVNQAAEPIGSSRVHRTIRILIVLAVATIMVTASIARHYVKRKPEGRVSLAPGLSKLSSTSSGCEKIRTAMPASYKIDKGRRFVLSTISGELTYAEALAHQRELAADADFDPSFAHVADFTYATLGKVSPEEILKFAQRSVFSAEARRALVFSGAADYGLGRMYETLRGLEGQAGVRAFLTLEEAMDWIVGPLPDE